MDNGATVIKLSLASVFSLSGSGSRIVSLVSEWRCWKWNAFIMHHIMGWRVSVFSSPFVSLDEGTKVTAPIIFCGRSYDTWGNTMVTSGVLPDQTQPNSGICFPLEHGP